MYPPPRAYLPIALLTLFGPLPVMLLAGDQIHPSAGGLALLVILLVGLARGSRLAWTLLLLWHAVLVLAVGAMLAWPWPANGILALAMSAASVGLLLSSSMRRHVAAQTHPARPLREPPV